METEMKMESGSDDAGKKLKLARSIVIIATVIMTIMAVVIIMDHAKLIKAESAFTQGYNKCAQLCNSKLGFYQERCFPQGGIDVPEEITPVLNDSQIEGIMITLDAD